MNVPQPSSVTAPQVSQQPKAEPKLKGKPTWLMPVVLLGGVACLIIGVVAFNVITSPFSLQEQMDTLTGRASRMSAGDTLIHDPVTIPAGGVHRIPFTVQENWRNVRLQGKFSVTRGNGVEAFVTDSNGRTLYQSRGTTYGDLDVPLPAGTYYLTFSNESSSSDVTINARVDIHYNAASYR